MKCAIILLVFLILFPELLICQAENYFTGFRIPKTSATNLILLWNINLSGKIKTFSRGTDQRRSHRASQVIPTIFFDYFSESEQTQLALFSDSQNKWDHDTQKINSSGGGVEENNSTLWESRNSISFSLNWYPTSLPVSFYLNSSSVTDYTDSKYEMAGLPSSRTRELDIAIASPVGVSVGRVRDATVIFRAIRVFERLEEIGLLTRQPSREAIHHLAKLMYKLREYQTNYERFEKFFMPKVMSFLKNRNYINVPKMEVLAALKVFEVFSENVFTRQRGWRIFVGYGAQGEYVWKKERSRNNEVNTGNSTKTTRSNRIFGLVEGGGNIYLPLTTRLQLDGVVSGVFSNQSLPNRYTWTNLLRLSYEIAERWDVSLSAGFVQSHGMVAGFNNIFFRRATKFLANSSFQPFFLPEVFSGSFILNAPYLNSSTLTYNQKIAPVNISLRYFIEDRVFLALQTQLTYREDSYGIRRGDFYKMDDVLRKDRRDWRIVMSVFYNII